ncbi:hypothetical protein Cgig2_003863 [Carnegiea gigantea]|uniref:DUF4283 domain-containing protein n=1 Tax=Carnegiea gigantea TaxID=171969 RepID=A0A9Q1QCJ3_9CARY|nr:hypothetical protein Cgig2_003863 [Carnegiea gigantea]
MGFLNDRIGRGLAKSKLTADEEQVVIDAEEEDSAAAELISLCLHARSPFNPRAPKSVFHNLWKPSKGLVVRDLDSNLFALQFFSTADRDFVLNEGPWVFHGCILLLKQMTGLEMPSEVEFTIARFWVKAYDDFFCSDSHFHDPNLQYGSWLRASPLKSRRCDADVELFLAFKHKSAPSKARAKLVFNNPTFSDKPDQPPHTDSNPSNMIIDGSDIVAANPEVFKGKQEDAQLNKGVFIAPNT